MGAEVEPGGVARTANHDATLHDLCRVGGGLAAHHVRVRERPGALQELPVADARREPAVRRRRDRGPRGAGAGAGGVWETPVAGKVATSRRAVRIERMTQYTGRERERARSMPGPASLRSVLLRPCGRSAPASPSDPERLRIRPYRPRRAYGSPRPGSP